MSNVGRFIVAEDRFDVRNNRWRQQLPASIMILARSHIETANVRIAKHHLRAAQGVCLGQNNNFTVDQARFRRRLQLWQHVVEDKHPRCFISMKRGVHVGFGLSRLSRTKAKHAQVIGCTLEIAFKGTVLDDDVLHRLVFPIR